VVAHTHSLAVTTDRHVRPAPGSRLPAARHPLPAARCPLPAPLSRLPAARHPTPVHPQRVPRRSLGYETSPRDPKPSPRVPSAECRVPSTECRVLIAPRGGRSWHPATRLQGTQLAGGVRRAAWGLRYPPMTTSSTSTAKQPRSSPATTSNLEGAPPGGPAARQPGSPAARRLVAADSAPAQACNARRMAANRSPTICTVTAASGAKASQPWKAPG